MKRIAFGIAFFLLSCIACSQSVETGPTTSPPQIGAVAERTMAAVVKITMHNGGHGTGFGITHNRILTAAHVVDDVLQVAMGEITTADGQTCEFDWLRVSTEHDVAMIGVKGCELTTLAVRTRPLVLGEEVAGAGHPYSYGSMWSPGNITTLEADHGPFMGTALGVSAPMLPGMSGGPLVDAGGAVVGVCVWIEPVKGMSHARAWGGMTFAVPIEHIPEGWFGP